ncbi:MAG: hypothetical protein ACTH0S_06610 [Senegalia sp. (in: firmicutes)]
MSKEVQLQKEERSKQEEAEMREQKAKMEEHQAKMEETYEITISNKDFSIIFAALNEANKNGVFTLEDSSLILETLKKFRQ